MSSTMTDEQLLKDVITMLETAQKLCRQAADVLQRNGRYGWSEEPYDWDEEIGEYLYIMRERLF